LNLKGGEGKDEIVARIDIIGAVHLYVHQLHLVPDLRNDYAHADGMLSFRQLCMRDAW
jgi:hypothetical protein